MKQFTVNALAFMAIVAVIALFGTADAWEQGLISNTQNFWQSALCVALATAFGLGAWVIDGRR